MNLFLIFWLLITISIFVSFHFKKKLLERLKDRHNDLYKKLGEPTHFTKHPVSTKFIFTGPPSLIQYTEFMANNGWESLGDEVLKDIGNKMKYTQYFSSIFFVIMFSFFVYSNFL